MAELIESLANRPTLLLATAGPASEAVKAALGHGMQRGALRAAALPLLSQADYDHLLWSCAINWVRGEDSLVRAQWAGRPFVWQIYPQDDGAEVVKLDAFLDRFLDCEAGAPKADLASYFASDMRSHWRGWNGWAPLPLTLPDTQCGRGRPWHGAIPCWRSAI